jgi:hypothetical protein
MDKKIDIKKGISDARLDWARAALATPGITHEYGRYQQAKRALALAQKELQEAEAAWLKLIKPAVDEQRAKSGRCQASRDGDCWWSGCPQLSDNEPKATGRCCPLPQHSDEL